MKGFVNRKKKKHILCVSDWRRGASELHFKKKKRMNTDSYKLEHAFPIESFSLWLCKLIAVGTMR